MLYKVQITALVPVFNEQKTIQRVISDLSHVVFLDQIIIVDDSSTDNSWQLIKSSKAIITSLRNSKNLGKGHSIYNGLKKIPKNYNGIVLFLDSDILGYSEKNLKKMIKPVLSESYDWTSGTTQYKTYKKPGWLTKYIGQRCYKYSDIKPFLNEFKKTGKYGLEVLLNHKLKNKNNKLVYLSGTKHLLKTEKRNLSSFIREYLLEFASITKAEVLNVLNFSS